KRLGEAREVIAESLAETTGGLDEGFAREVELRILFEGGDLAGATRALARARELGGQRTRVILDIDEARILVARGQPRRAMALLGGALEHARKNGALGQRMEAETALGEAELAAGLKSGARRLAAVEREAAAHGFAHLAREAAELRARPARAR
ncbi:MAG TPA: hypothetical protein VEL05_07970, partial [Candidatus Acidoferrum sp.]|nr:hypothetical protein [Candidatus Acidoferrum sp.]